MNLSLFDIDPGAAVPERYAAWRPLVRDAVDVFLAGLSPERIGAIATAQMALRKNASAERRLVALMMESPLLHKLGQVLARHPALNRPIREQLQGLEMLAAVHSLDDIREHVLGELGSAAATYSVDLCGEPIAEGSVAIVTPCTWRRHPGAEPEKAVLKILKPGISDRLHEDLRILDDVMTHLDTHKADYSIPGMAYRETLESVRDLLHCEVKLGDEQRNMREAASVFAGNPAVHIPELLPFCTPRMTAMEHLSGCRVTDVPVNLAADSGLLSRDRLAETIMQSIVCHVIFDKAHAPLYHADPHAGNLWATNEGKLGLIDWSLVGRLDKGHRETLAQIAFGALRLSRRQVERGILRLCKRPVPVKTIRPVVERALRAIRRGQLPGLAWMTDLLEGAASEGLVFPSDLVLFRKSLFTLKGVLHDLDPTRNADWLFVREALLRFLRESPRRAWSLPFSRKFSTHLSNVDLLRAYIATPLVIGRFCAGTLRDFAPSSS